MTTPKDYCMALGKKNVTGWTGKGAFCMTKLVLDEYIPVLLFIGRIMPMKNYNHSTPAVYHLVSQKILGGYSQSPQWQVKKY